MTAEEEELKILASGYGKLKQQNEVLMINYKYALETIEDLNEQILLQKDMAKWFFRQGMEYEGCRTEKDPSFNDTFEVEWQRWIDEYKKKHKDLETISEPKKPSKCHIMGIECLFPKITCPECIVYKEYQGGYCPETRKLIEEYNKDRESTVSRPNKDMEEI